MRFLCFGLPLLLSTVACSQTVTVNENWRKPLEPHRVVGNLYYVGTFDLACYLITSPQGHILINTGLADSAATIRANVEKLGFKFSDIKTLLTMQAHFDHVEAMAEIQKQTGARVLATQEDAKVLEDGGRNDFHFGSQYSFAPVKVAAVLKHGQRIPAGDTELVVQLTPGHTKGSSSYTMKVQEGGKDYSVCIANMGSINPGVKLLNNAKYPNIADDYAKSFELQKSLTCDIFVSAHAGQYGLHGKWKPGTPYSPATFVDPAGYRKAVQSYEATFRKQLAEEKAAAGK